MKGRDCDALAELSVTGKLTRVVGMGQWVHHQSWDTMRLGSSSAAIECDV